MGLRFSDDGPEFPVELVDALLNGEAVFLCGAGVSAPQLPGFKDLVDRVYASVGAEKSPGEREASDAGRFEEALGALSRRLSNQGAMYDAVRALLVNDEPDLDHHKTLLRLSRDLDSRPALITTNFDTFFEKAIEQSQGPAKAKSYSLAGQALPPPGSDDFQGIIHLHGRIADNVIGLEDTPLVLTSAEYGDAYMRSGWASRFLFDLVRCRTLVLVGYRAGDAPVRYFLNVLEADRERFTDLKKVYALDSVEADAAQARERWEALAVEPLAYQSGKTSTERHAALWRDLAKLADLVDTPKAWRRARAAEILAEGFETRSPSELGAINWIFAGKRDVWDVAIRTILDPKWFDHFISQKLMSDNDAGWVLAAWCALGWTDPIRLDAAVAWHQRFGRAFGEALEQRIATAAPTTPLYFKAWSLLARATRPQADRDLQAYRVAARVRGPHRTDADLRAGVRLLRPRINIGKRHILSLLSEERADPPARLNDLLLLRLEVDDRGGMPEIGGTLRGAADATDRLIQMATEELRTTIELAREAEFIGPGWDLLDTGLPSVEAHGQNEHRDGAVYLTELLTELFPRVAEASPAKARLWAETWCDLPSQIGVRLWLHALRRPDLYSADEVAKAIALLPKENFWSIRRELVLAMAERLADADPQFIELLCERILTEGPTRYDELPSLTLGTNDWRPQVRDRDVWLRLTALRRAGVLPERGSAELEAIADRHSFIAGDFTDRDLFGSSYLSGFSYVSGNAAPLLNAEPEDRLEIAQTLAADWDPNTQQSWSAYCAADPSGALEALRQGGFAEANTRLWNDLIGTLSWVPQTEADADRATRDAIVRGVFECLEGADDAFLSRIVNRLVDLRGVANFEAALADAWWDRLWSIIELENEPLDLSGSESFYERIMNEPAARLSNHLISTINGRKRRSRRISDPDRERLRRIMGSDTKAGWIARGNCVRDASFMLFVDRNGALDLLRPWLVREDLQGSTLRSVLVQFARLSRPATRAYRKELMDGVVESQASGEAAVHVASSLLRPLLIQAMSERDQKWGLKTSEVRDVLKRASPSILEGAAHCLRIWVTPTDEAPERAWRQGVRSVFKDVWPPELKFKSASHTRDLAAMCVNARDEFPDAFATVRHNLVPYDGDWIGLHFFNEPSAVPDKFPETTLDLLWSICGPGCTGESTDLGKILDRIATANADLIIDRRYQWLEQRATRYD